MIAFYDRLERLRHRLTDVGQANRAEELLVAERSASTSGEALSNVTVVLERLRGSPELGDAELQADIGRVIADAELLWKGIKR